MRAQIIASTIFLLAAACSSGQAAAESPTPQASPLSESPSPTSTQHAPSPTPAPDHPSPTAAPDLPSPTPARQDPWLAVLDHYPAEGETDVSTHTTLQFVIYRPMPVMRLSLSPEVPLEQVEFPQHERWSPEGGLGEMYLYRPQSPLAPNTTYEATLEVGYTDGTGQEHRSTRVWRFTTSDLPKHDYANQVVLPLLSSAGEGGAGALMEGELSIAGHCLYVGEGKSLPLFEEGTVWWEGDVLFFRGERYEIGDTLPLGGGEAFHDLSLYDFVQEPDESCETGNAWVNVP